MEVCRCWRYRIIYHKLKNEQICSIFTMNKKKRRIQQESEVLTPTVELGKAFVYVLSQIKKWIYPSWPLLPEQGWVKWYHSKEHPRHLCFDLHKGWIVELAQWSLSMIQWPQIWSMNCCVSEIHEIEECRHSVFKVKLLHFPGQYIHHQIICKVQHNSTWMIQIAYMWYWEGSGFRISKWGWNYLSDFIYFVWRRWLTQSCYFRTS